MRLGLWRPSLNGDTQSGRFFGIAPFQVFTTPPRFRVATRKPHQRLAPAGPHIQKKRDDYAVTVSTFSAPGHTRPAAFLGD